MTDQTARLIALPYFVKLFWGRVERENPSASVLPQTLTHCLLLLSPSKLPALFNPTPSFPSLAYVAPRKESGFRTTSDWKIFLGWIMKENNLQIDSALGTEILEKIRAKSNKLKFVILNTSSLFHLTSDEIREFEHCYSLAEMAMVYACSYIKPEVEVEEIRYQVHDYLNAKTGLRGEATSRIDCRTIIKKKIISALIPPASVHFEIGLTQMGISVSFFKTAAIVDPSLPSSPSIVKMKKTYSETLVLFKNIISRINSIDLNKILIAEKVFPKLFSKEKKKFQLFFHSLAEHPGFIPIDAEDTLEIKNNSVYSLCLYAFNCDIIMGAAFVVENQQIRILDKYGWDYLQFPW